MTAAPSTAAEWADAIEQEVGDDWDQYSLAWSAGRIAGVELAYPDIDGRDDGGTFVAQNGWIAVYDAQSGHWYAR